MREDWEECTLTDVCEKAIKVKRKEMPSSKQIKYLDIGGIDNILNIIISYKAYSWKDAPSRAQQIVKKGDVLFSTVRTYLKNIAQVDKEEYNNEICSSGFTVLRGMNNLVEPNYLFQYSLSIGFLNPLSKLQTGTSYPAVRDKDVFAQPFPLPPLPIQRAIVAKIETLFSDLDNGIADLKKAQQQLKIYRQAVLKKAFEGGLTKPHKDWVKHELKDLVNFSQGIQVPKNKQYTELSKNHVRFIRIIDFTQGKDEPRYIPNPGDRYLVKKDDISMVRYGATTGFICTGIDGAIANNLFKITPKVEILNRLLFYFFQSPFFNQILSFSLKGAAMPAISFGLLNNIELSYPPSVTEQHQIIREIESRLSVCDKVEQNLIEGLVKAQALRQSILKKAFEGKLLSTTEIEKCKQEADYEPAGFLLERIKNKQKK